MIWLCVCTLLLVHTQSEFSVVNLTALSTPCEVGGQVNLEISILFYSVEILVHSFLEKCRFTNPTL